MYRLHARLIFFVSLICLGATAQEQDFGNWWSASFSHKVDTRWSIGLAEQVRLNRNLSTVDLYFSEASLQYVFAKNLKASVNYRFIRKNELDAWTTRHGFFADLTWKRKLKPFVFSIRGRVQARVEDFFNPEQSFSPDLFFRGRIQASYDLGGRTKSFVSAESFVMLQSKSDPYLDGSLTRMRYEAGIQYDFDKRNSLSLSYMIQNNRIVRLTEFVVCIGYSYSF